MWLLVFMILELWLLLRALFRSHWMVGLPICFIYWLYWSDPAEQHGRRMWSAMRGWRIWTVLKQWWFPIEYKFVFPQTLHGIGEVKGGQYLFLVDCTHYLVTPFLIFGLHGNVPTIKKLNLLWTAPKLFFYLPLLRDVLLWTGAIQADAETIITAINCGYSVVHCAAGLTHPGEKTKPEVEQQLFAIVAEKQMSMVPVFYEGEKELYKHVANPALRQAQCYCKQLVGYPFPYVVSGSFFSFLPKRVPLRVRVAVPIEAGVTASAEELQRKYAEAIGELNGKGKQEQYVDADLLV